jgi:microcystin-dependent protein
MKSKTLIVGCIALLIAIAVVAAAEQRAAKAKRPLGPETLKPLPPDFAYAGEVRAFAGEHCPANWLPADGKEYPDAGHKKLVAEIGDLWGTSAVGRFKVPDLRGIFLRGWNNKRDPMSGDPEAAKRNIPTGAPIDPTSQGDQVGTSQADEIVSHHHSTTATARWGDRYADTIGWGADNGQHPHGNFSIDTSAAGGAETRPRNAYVLYCIRDGG